MISKGYLIIYLVYSYIKFAITSIILLLYFVFILIVSIINVLLNFKMNEG